MILKQFCCLAASVSEAKHRAQDSANATAKSCGERTFSDGVVPANDSQMRVRT